MQKFGNALIAELALKGMDIIRKVGQTETTGSDRPKKDVVIADCGELPVSEPFSVTKDDAVE